MQEVLKTPETEEVEAPKFVTPEQIKAMVFEVIEEKETEDENFFVPENWEPDFDKFFESFGNVNRFAKKVCDTADNSKKDIAEENWIFLESVRDRLRQKINAVFNPKKTKELRSFLNYLEDQEIENWNTSTLKEFQIGGLNVGQNIFMYCYNHYESDFKLMISDLLPKNQAQQLIEKFKPVRKLAKKEGTPEVIIEEETSIFFFPGIPGARLEKTAYSCRLLNRKKSVKISPSTASFLNEIITNNGEIIPQNPRNNNRCGILRKRLQSIGIPGKEAIETVQGEGYRWRGYSAESLVVIDDKKVKTEKFRPLEINAGSEVSNLLGTYTNDAQGHAEIEAYLNEEGLKEGDVRREEINNGLRIELWFKE